MVGCILAPMAVCRGKGIWLGCEMGTICAIAGVIPEWIVVGVDEDAIDGIDDVGNGADMGFGRDEGIKICPTCGINEGTAGDICVESISLVNGIRGKFKGK